MKKQIVSYLFKVNPAFGNLSLDTRRPLKDKRKENDEVVEKILQFGEKHLKISKHIKSLGYKLSIA